jgi:hypothetical protein
MIYLSIQDFTEAWRRFEYDYIFIDGVFFLVWLGLLIKKKKWNPIKFGVITAIIVYFIDAVFWWNLPANANYPPETTIREYWIGGVKVPKTLGEYFLPKAGADFMMCISYSMFIFPWLWIVFENFVKKNAKEILIFTSLFFTSWFLTPFLSFWLPINNTLVETVRHMDTQMIVWIVNVIIGYTILCLIYGTNKFGKKNLKYIAYVFIIGCLGSFFMEFPLFITGIRPTGIDFLIFEIFILFNQGAPYLFIAYDIVLPKVITTLKGRLTKKTELSVEMKN